MDKPTDNAQTVATLLAAVSTLQAACVDAVEHGEISDVNAAKAWIRQLAYQLLLLRQFILLMHGFQVPLSLTPGQFNALPPEAPEAPLPPIVTAAVKRKRKPKAISVGQKRRRKAPTGRLSRKA